jgi:hypothetical protein
MIRNGNRAKFFQSSLALLLLTGLVIGVEGQHDKKSSPPPPKASAPAPHTSAPARPATNRPAPGSRPSNVPARPGTTGSRTASTTNRGTGTGTGKASGPATTRNNMRGPGGTPGSNTARGGARPGSNAVNRPLPGKQVSLRGGGTASIRPNGQIRSINRNGMQISRGLNGTRRVESVHNGARIVTTGKHSGYVQRAYVTRNGRTYVSRTVVVNHVTYTSVYRSYSYGGYCCYYGYHPAFYYGPAYYGWAYNPWPAPVYYGWGWGGAPWYGYYGGYFAPYPAYPSAAFWLTDYVISANLQAAYQAQAAAGGNDNGGSDQQQAPQQQPANTGNDNSANNSTNVTLTPEVKEAIAEEVKAQLAAEQSAAQQGSSGGQQQASATPSANTEEVPPALDPARRTFIVASDLTVSSDGQECQLSAGDVIKRTSETPDDDRKVTATVSASKKSDCAAGKQIAVGVDDLQEMHNHFEEQLDNGMKDLSSKQGTNGLPKAPDTTAKPSDVPPPPPDNSAAKALDEQQAAADQTEAQVMKEAFSQGS